ncbi:MAG: hypothetical protein LUG57_08675 [Oscillospiraceae bacterium]|nr:hypothetical protein [Oscillospiraceae bacterium]
MGNKKETNKKTGGLRGSNIFWAILSLLIAVVVWVYYTSNYSSAITRTFYGVEVTYTGEDTMRDSLSLIISEEENTTVAVTLSGSRRELGKLTSSGLKAVVNLSGVTRAGYRTMAYTLSYPSSVNSNSIEVVSQSPQTVGLQISKLATKVVEFTGSFVGTVADGYAIDSDLMTFDPSYVTIIGPEEELEQISAAQVLVDRDDVSTTFTVTANYTFVNSAGEAPSFDDLTVDTESVTVTVPVSMVKTVALDVALVDGGGATSDNVIKTITPTTITLAGDTATLENINTITLATIDLSDYLGFPTTEYTIVLPDGVECLSGETTATVSLEFTGLESAVFSVTNLSYINLPSGYTASILTQNLVVTIRAASDVLSQISANNIRAVADLTDVTTTSRVPVTIYVDGFDGAGAVGDYIIYIQIAAEEVEDQS